MRESHETEWDDSLGLERVWLEDSSGRNRRTAVDTENNDAEEWKQEEKEERKNRRNTQRSVLEEVLYNSLFLLIVLLVTLFLVKYVGQRTTVSGSSMEPMIHDGDNLIVDKVSYRFHDPERFDIIVFPFEYQEDTYYIKRIIGLPGETVRIDEEGNIYIDGEILDEDYGAEVIRDPGIAYQEITLGANQYFVLGDNRNNSSDSRNPAVGLIDRSRIIGRAWLRIYPFDSFGWIKHQ